MKSVATRSSKSKSQVEESLSAEELRKMDAFWRACNYLCVGMLYLLENPLLRKPLKVEHIKHRLLGHWGSDPGQTFVWVHLNRLIKKYDLDMILFQGLDMGRRLLFRIVIWRACIRRSIRIRVKMSRGCRSFSSSFPFRVG